MNVWVMELELTEGGGWTSVHTSEAGAFNRLKQRCADIGVEVICDNYRDMVSIGELDDEPEIEAYGISKLPVEE